MMAINRDRETANQVYCDRPVMANDTIAGNQSLCDSPNAHHVTWQMIQDAFSNSKNVVNVIVEESL